MKLHFILSLVIAAWLLCACAAARETAVLPVTPTPVRAVSPTVTSTPAPQPTAEMAVLSPANIAQLQQVTISEGEYGAGPFTWSADGRRLLALSENQAFLLDAYTSEMIWSKGISGLSYGSFRPDGREIVLATFQTLFFVDARTGADTRQVTCVGDGKFLSSLGGFRGISFSRDWQRVAYAYTDGFQRSGDSYIYVTTPAKFCSPRLLHKQAGTMLLLHRSGFSGDGKYLLGVFANGALLWRTPDPEHYTAGKAFPGRSGLPFFNSDASLLAVNDRTAGKLSIFDIDTLEPIGSFYDTFDDERAEMELNPEGSLAAMWDGFDKAAVIKVWDTQTGGVVQVLKDLPGMPRALSFSPDGRLLAILFIKDGYDPRVQIGIWGVRK